MFVAETDFPLAPAITRALTRAVELGDTGYTPPNPGVREAFVGFAERKWDWRIDPSHVFWTADVMVGVVEILRRVIAPGDRVVVMPPVYPPFYDTVVEAGGVVERVPLRFDGAGWDIDIEAVGRALAAGAPAGRLGNPPNPPGATPSAAAPAAPAGTAGRVRAAAGRGAGPAPPPPHPGGVAPPPPPPPAAPRVGYAVTSASKTFNLAGLKCAVMIGGGEAQAHLLRSLPSEVEWRTGLFGALANVAAFAPESQGWLDGLLAALEINRSLLADLLAEHLPAARYLPPQAGYLAWVDVSAYGWGDDPARRILKEAKVALHHGPLFGSEGIGHVRINFGCAPDVLRDAVQRLGALAASS